jgi:hypothetical protein
MMMADDHAGNTRLMFHTTLIPMFAEFFFFAGGFYTSLTVYRNRVRPKPLER